MRNASQKTPPLSTRAFVIEKLIGLITQKLSDKAVSEKLVSEVRNTLQKLMEAEFKEGFTFTLQLQSDPNQCSSTIKKLIKNSGLSYTDFPDERTTIEINLQKADLLLLQYGDVRPLAVVTTLMYEKEILQVA